MFYKILTIWVAFNLASSTTYAQTNQASLFMDETKPSQVRKLNWLNEQFLIKQRNRLEGITRRHFGQQLKTGKGNIPLLQRLIDENIIPQSDTMELQAMGVVLGDIFVDHHKNLSWRVYEDDLGPSHAVCVDNSEHCLFPVTMLSRRIEVGLKPRVDEVFDRGMVQIKPYLPRLPFSN